MLLVADSSALIALAICDGLNLLALLYEEVKVPTEVFTEVTQPLKKEAKKLADYLKDKIADINIQDYIISDFNLGVGELHAMALYKKLNADIMLVDDKKARQIAEFNGIKIIGSIGILLLAHRKKLLINITDKLNMLKNSDLHLSSVLIKNALEIAKTQK